ncbi:hypothetical protein V6N11_021719 [Hibiscus sabdariffa]|uniref:Uncharacterized protein n=1 Tax=Hibiscus sabdariffa TaxID=183260 RepID=A0ABR2TH21_9ROSI
MPNPLISPSPNPPPWVVLLPHRCFAIVSLDFLLVDDVVLLVILAASLLPLGYAGLSPCGMAGWRWLCFRCICFAGSTVVALCSFAGSTVVAPVGRAVLPAPLVGWENAGRAWLGCSQALGYGHLGGIVSLYSTLVLHIPPASM